LLLVINNEIVLKIIHTQGLLWRATEQLLEYRNLSLTSGYYARLDYVSFYIQEIGFNPDRARITEDTSLNLLFINSIMNHFLNTACTIADAGALGAIL